MYQKTRLPGFFVVMLASIVNQATAQGPLTGSWQGTIEFRSQSTVIELAIQTEGENANVLLSLPKLGYFWEPLSSSWISTTAVNIELPFGLGTTRLDRQGEFLVGRRVIGDDELILKLTHSLDGQVDKEPSDHEFMNGEIILRGFLYATSKPQARGTILVLHGSNQNGVGDWGYRGWAGLLGRMGYDVFLYNKRPPDSGRHLTDLVEDAKSALQYLCRRNTEESSTPRIGIAGGSQAGWIAAALAAQGPESISWVAITGWPAVTPREQELQRIAHEFLADGYSHREIEDALAYANLYFCTARNLDLWPQLESATANALQQKWGDFVETPRNPQDLAWWKANQSYPTWDHLALIRCPVFAAWGERDYVVPPSSNAHILRQVISKNGNQDVSIKIYPEADHRIEMTSRNADGQFRWPQLSADFLIDLENWLRHRQF